MFLKGLFFFFSIVFSGLVIQGESRGTIVLISLGIKFDIIFKKFSVNVLTCQIKIKMLEPRKIGHTPLDSSCICFLIIPHFSLKPWRWRYSKIYFTMNDLVVSWSVTTRSPKLRMGIKISCKKSCIGIFSFDFRI